MITENIFQEKERGIYDIYVPSLGRVFPFREITLSQQKRMAKSIITGDEVYCTEFLYTLLSIINENAVENISLETLTLHDILLIAVGMRANSIGYKMKLNVTCKLCKATLGVESNLSTIYDELIKINPVEYKLETDNFLFKYALPTAQKEKNFLYNVKSIITKNKDVIESFIVLNIDRYVNEIFDKRSEKKIENTDLKSICDFYRALPIDVFDQLLNMILNINNHLKDIILFDTKCVKECPAHLVKRLSYDIEYFYGFLKLIFSEDLMALYKDIYYLQKIGIEPEYAEGLTVPERRLIWNYFLADEERKRQYKEQLTVR